MITNIVLLVLTRNNIVLKDIYSPLEIDDQWDQRAPSHEDKVEGGDPVAMDSAVEAIRREDPSGGGGGVAVAERPVQDLSVNPDAQPQPAVENTMESAVPGMQTSNESNGNITNIGQMTVPANPEVSAQDSASTEPTEAEQAPVTMEDAFTEPTGTGTETLEKDSDDEAANSMLHSQSQGERGDEHDVPASPFDATNSEDGPRSSNEPADETIESRAEIPTTTVEPDKAHQSNTSPATEPESSEEDAVSSIINEPLTDDEKESVATDTDQMPVSPEPVSSETHDEETDGDDEVSAEIKKAEDEVLRVIENKLEAHRARKEKLEAQLHKFEQDKADADAKATSTQAQIDQVEAAISELESKK